MNDEVTIKELFEAKLMGIKAEIRAGYDITNLQLKQVIQHQKETNGKLKIVHKETSFSRWCYRNAVWAISLFCGSVVLIIIFHKEIIQILLNKI